MSRNSLATAKNMSLRSQAKVSSCQFLCRPSSNRDAAWIVRPKQRPLISLKADRLLVRAPIEIEMQGDTRTVNEARQHIHIIVGLDLKATDAIDLADDPVRLADEPQHEIDPMAFVEKRPSPKRAACHEEILIALPGVPIGEMGRHMKLYMEQAANCAFAPAARAHVREAATSATYNPSAAAARRPTSLPRCG